MLMNLDYLQKNKKMNQAGNHLAIMATMVF